MLGKKKPKSVKLTWLEDADFIEELGEIRIGGVRHALDYAGFYSELRDELIKIIGPAADGLLYEMNRKHARKVVSDYINKNPALRLLKKTKKGRNEMAKHVVSLLTLYGFGKVELVKIDLDGESVVRLYNSFVATGYSTKQSRPVCSVIAGLIAGGAEAIGSRSYECKEVKCLAMGDEYCEFVIKKVE